MSFPWRNFLDKKRWRKAGKVLLQKGGPPALAVLAGQLAEHIWDVFRPGYGLYANLIITGAGVYLLLEKMLVYSLAERRWRKNLKRAEELSNAGRHKEALRILEEDLAEIRDFDDEASKR